MLAAPEGCGRGTPAGRSAMVAAAISTTAKEVELVAGRPAHRSSALQREKFLPVTRVRADGSADGGQRLAERRRHAGAPLPALPRLLAAAFLHHAAARAGAQLRAVQPRQRSAHHAQVLGRGAHDAAQAAGGADLRVPRAGQLHARRPRRSACHPDQGLALRPRPAGGPQGLRGDPDLLSRRHHHHRAAARSAEGLRRLEGGEDPGLPAAVPAVQAEAVRGAGARGDAGAARSIATTPSAT